MHRSQIKALEESSRPCGECNFCTGTFRISDAEADVLPIGGLTQIHIEKAQPVVIPVEAKGRRGKGEMYWIRRNIKVARFIVGVSAAIGIRQYEGVAQVQFEGAGHRRPVRD